MADVSCANTLARPKLTVTDSDRDPAPSSPEVHYSFCCIHDGVLSFHTAFMRDPAIARQQCTAKREKAKTCPASISTQIEGTK